MLANLETWFLYLMIYSFIGWAYESLLCSITGRKWVNRGFLNGPICPIYGVGAVCVVLALSPLKFNIPLLFVASALLTTTLEYFTSWLMEVAFNARWWDYSKNKFNINGRVCLIGFLAFGAMSVGVICFLHPLVESLVAMLPPLSLHIVSGVALMFFLADLAFTLTAVLKLASRMAAIKRAIGERIDSTLADIKEAGWFRSFQTRRLMNAFPRIHFNNYHEVWQQLKAYYNQRMGNGGEGK